VRIIDAQGCLHLTKAIQLLSLFPRRPVEFMDRISTMVATRRESFVRECLEYRVADAEQGTRTLLAALNSGGKEGFAGVGVEEIEARVRERQAQLPKDAPFGRFHDGDMLLGRLCYLAARLLPARMVVETGVCYGVTSAYLLKALELNEAGYIHSIDLPPLGKNGDDYVGWLVPQELRARWRLHRGTSNRLLRPLLAELGQIDLFIHDSLHTYRNMRNEFALAWPALRPGGVLISDDIRGNKAFQELSELPDVAVSVVVKEESKDSLLGVAVKKK
jgi:predicted O-methyltransferase YrrM